MPHRPRHASGGFTLIEAALATVIVGVGFVATMQLAAACTGHNRLGRQVTTAAMLAGHVQEWAAPLPFSDPRALGATFGPEDGETADTFDDLDDFDGATFRPPRDALRRPLPDLARYAQTVEVTPVDPARPSRDATPGDAVRVTVRVLADTPDGAPRTVFEMSWVRMRS